MKTLFQSYHDMVYEHSELRSQIEIINEPQLFGASLNYAMNNGGPITQRTIELIRQDMEKEIVSHSKMGYHPLIDTKVTMLMPDWYPCIPGWHCDGVIRPQGKSQPDLRTLNDRVMHYTRIITDKDDACNTVVATEDVTIDVDEEAVWQSVDLALTKETVPQENIKSGQIIKFSRSTLHRCPPAVKACWRYFFRLSFYHMPCRNEIRTQTQVYLPVSRGW